MPDPTTQDLKIAQIKRERDERHHAEEADTGPASGGCPARGQGRVPAGKLEEQQAADEAVGRAG